MGSKAAFREKLNLHRKNAQSYSLHILVWGAGPSNKDCKAYRARCEIREELKRKGHTTDFSEELCQHEHSLINPILDENIQAKFADAIVMLYESRGTQTEHDRILLESTELMVKTVVVIRKEILNNIKTSISGTDWQDKTLKHALETVEYDTLPLGEKKKLEICMTLEKMRQEKYVRGLMRQDS